MVSTQLKLSMFYYNVRDIQQQFFKIGLLKNFAIFTGKHLSWSQHKCFPVNIPKYLRTAFFIEHLRWLLLQVLFKNVVPKNFAYFTKTYRYPSSFYQVADL